MRHISLPYNTRGTTDNTSDSEGPQLSRKTSSGPPLPLPNENKSEDIESITLTEGELDKKIVSFQGLKNDMDEKMSKTIGKLMVDEADEDVNADRQTYIELFKLIGGFKTVVFIAGTTIFNKYYDIYQDSLSQEFAMTDPESQGEKHSEFMQKIFFVALFGVVCRNTIDFLIAHKKRYMGADIHQNVLEKILLAPVNLFFDVTPIGKILQIFTEDMNVFQGEILEPLKHCMEMLSHVIVVSSILLTVGSVEVVLGFILMVYLCSKVARPYLHADNQLHKVGSTLWGPIHSYFHECMRGTTIIRAYGQEEVIMKKQNELLDKTTLHFIAHHSCWCWFNVRMQCITKIISVVALIVIANNRLTTNSVTLTLLYGWT